MGTSGTAIFSDDFAADVRDQWRRMVGDGATGPDATRRLIAEHADALTHPDEAAVFWLALALTQHRAGRVEPAVLDRAIRIIDDKEGLERWADDQRQLQQRMRALRKTRDELSKAPRAAFRIRKPYVDSSDWVVGELIAYTLRSGRLALFRVLRFHTDLGGTRPIVEILDWNGADVSTIPQEPEFSVRMSHGFTKPVSAMMISATSAREMPKQRIQRLGVLPSHAAKNAGQFPLAAPWSYLDQILAAHFDLS